MLKLLFLLACGSIALIHGFDIAAHQLQWAEQVFKDMEETHRDENFVTHPGVQYALMAFSAAVADKEYTPKEYIEYISSLNNHWINDLLAHKEDMHEFGDEVMKNNEVDPFQAMSEIAKMIKVDTYSYVPSFLLMRVHFDLSKLSKEEFKDDMSFLKFLDAFFVSRKDGLINIKNWFIGERTPRNPQALEELSKSMTMYGADSVKIVDDVKINLRFFYNFKEAEPGHFVVSPQVHKSVPMMAAVGQYLHGELPEMDATFISVPLKDGLTRFIIYVPNNLGGMKKIEENIHLMKDSYLTAHGQADLMRLRMPSFDVKTKTNLKQEFGKSQLLEIAAHFLANLEEESEVEPEDIMEVFENLHDSVYGISAQVSDYSDMHENEIAPQSEEFENTSMSTFEVTRSFYFQIKLLGFVVTEGLVVDPTL